jgi:hypothetical protein
LEALIDDHQRKLTMSRERVRALQLSKLQLQ